MALGAVLSGAEGGEDREEYGPAQAAWFQQFLALPHGMASPDTWRRVLSRRPPAELPPCCVSGPEALRESRDGESGALDGKTRRRSCAPTTSKGAIPMVSAGANANRLV